MGSPFKHSHEQPGSGVYATTFSNTSTAGNYRFTIRAAGMIPAVLDSFKRQTVQSIFVAPPFHAQRRAVRNEQRHHRGQYADHLGKRHRQQQAARSPVLPTVELSIGKGVSTPARYTLKASRITILQGSTIASDIYSNQLSNSGILGGTQYSPLSLPVVAALPPFEAASPGTKDVTVAQGKERNACARQIPQRCS